MDWLTSSAAAATIISAVSGIRSVFQGSKKESKPNVTVTHSPGAVVFTNSPSSAAVGGDVAATAAEESPLDKLRRVFGVSPGAGRTAARLILMLEDSEEAQHVFDAFRAAPVRTDETYPYAAMCIGAEDRVAMGDVMQSVPDEVEIAEVLDAVEDLSAE